MYKLVPVLVLTAAAGAAIPMPVVAAQRLMAPLSGPSSADTIVPQAALVLVGGMHGGGMGGGMFGGMGGGMFGGMGGGAVTGGMGGGAVTGGMGGGAVTGGMGGGGIGGMTSGGYQSNGGSSYASGEGRQQYYQCIAQHGQCTVTSAPGSLRRGASCTCLLVGEARSGRPRRIIEPPKKWCRPAR